MWKKCSAYPFRVLPLPDFISDDILRHSSELIKTCITWFIAVNLSEVLSKYFASLQYFGLNCIDIPQTELASFHRMLYMRWHIRSAFCRIPQAYIFSKIPCVWIRPTSIVCGRLLLPVRKIVQHKCGGCLAIVYKKISAPPTNIQGWFILTILKICFPCCHLAAHTTTMVSLCVCLSYWLFKTQ